MSSGFLDSLRRENKGKENLQYDDGAFYYFCTAFIVILVVPLLLSVLSQLFRRRNKFVTNKEIAPNLLGHDIQGVLEKKEKSGKINKALIFKVLLAIFLVFLYSRIVASNEESKELKSFDPYDILEIPKDTEDQDVIKQAFRRLSRKYHPDRNPDDPEAQNKFLLLTKAMNCLADEKTKENCEKFGNPEGSGGSFSIGIALPSFLLAKENRIPVLIVFFVFILIVVPYFVLSWYSEVSKYDMDGTLVEDKQIFIQTLNENLIVKNIPRNLALCLEFVPRLGVAANQKQDLSKLHNEVTEIIGKAQIEPRIVKPYDLIHAYMLDIPIGPSLVEDTLFILQTSPRLIEAMITFALKVPRIRVQNGIKAYGLRCAMSMIDFSQLFYQGVWQGDSPLLQLSVFNKIMIEGLKKKQRRFPEFSHLVRDANKPRSPDLNPDENLGGAIKELVQFPFMDIKAEVFVEDEQDIRLGDIVTLKVTLTRLNQDHKDTDFKYLRSNRFPFNEKEKWYVFVGDERRNLVLMSETAVFGNKTCEKKFLFPADNQGEFSLKIFVRSNGYLGLDFETEVRFKVQDRIQKKKYEIHPDDLKIKNEPTFFEQLTQGVKAEEDNSDEELEEEVPKKRPEAQAQAQAQPAAAEKEQEIPKGKVKAE